MNFIANLVFKAILLIGGIGFAGLCLRSRL